MADTVFALVGARYARKLEHDFNEFDEAVFWVAIQGHELDKQYEQVLSDLQKFNQRQQS
jgi:hypothetical protein